MVYVPEIQKILAHLPAKFPTHADWVKRVLAGPLSMHYTK
jgi:hypothetical protein